MYPPNIVLNLKPYTFTITGNCFKWFMKFQIKKLPIGFSMKHPNDHVQPRERTHHHPIILEVDNLKRGVCVCDNSTTIFSNLNYHSWIKDTHGFISCDDVNYPSSYPSYRLGPRSLNWRFQVFWTIIGT
jgi:hypothetical protein